MYLTYQSATRIYNSERENTEFMFPVSEEIIAFNILTWP